MPTSPDYPCIVINAKNGYNRTNNSWVIGRIVRDFGSWMSPETQKRLEEILKEKYLANLSKSTNSKEKVDLPMQAGLCVSVYEVDSSKEAGVPEKDIVYWSGFFITILQIGIAMIPLGLHDNWSTAIITIGGIILSFATGSLPQWKKEKWSCRRHTKKSFILTEGNGAQHAIVILGNGYGLDLEDLASGSPNTRILILRSTQISILALAVFWVSLMITSSGQKTNTWYLMIIGGLGILHNIAVAGWRRQPAALGVHLKFREVIGHSKVMETLLAVEQKYPQVGRSMLSTFFPQDLNLVEKRRWEELEQGEGKKKDNKVVDTKSSGKLSNTTHVT
jgi:hypothetical protein